MRRSIETAYARAPHFASGAELISPYLVCRSQHFASFLHVSLLAVCRQLKISTRIEFASHIDPAHDRKGVDRILELCHATKAATYVNASGGRHLYCSQRFARSGLTLEFLAPYDAHGNGPSQLRQSGDVAEPLSVIDLLMHNSTDAIAAEIGTFDASLIGVSS